MRRMALRGRSILWPGARRRISLGGLSKTLGLPGLRIGWLASRNAAFLNRVAELKDYTSICPPAPSEALAFIALRARRPLLDRCRGIVADGLAALRPFVAEHTEHLEWSQPTAGNCVFLRLRGDVSAGAYCSAIHRRAGLNIVPSSLFEECKNDRLRVTYGRADLRALLDRWGALLRSHGLTFGHATS
ncbi:unnamed protein product [Polarella glacialis]|uniref:Aminotransferase class I/classII large domain-containing protein n=1 Tax=Polarella glacialis TaxID=89957 RepID=A0A813FBN9_POLGL|nr:unnamed protein product [Polarella glacialis]